MATHLEIELDRLRRKLLRLGAAVEEGLHDALRAFARREGQLAARVIDDDVQVDGLEVDLEEDCLKVLALYQPVARDLRLIVAVLKINNDLERVGDLAVNIAERVVSLCGKPPLGSPYDVVGMGEQSRAMLRKSLDAFVNLDAGLAHEVCRMDDTIDAMNREAYSKIVDAMKGQPGALEALINYISISRNLERVADHSTNIAENVIALLEGEIVRHRLEDFDRSAEEK